MSRSLPSRPSLDQLRHQAKDVLKAHRAGDAAGCTVLRRLPSLSAATDAQLLAARVTLVDVQFALALEYGFDNWPALKQHVEKLDASGASLENLKQPPLNTTMMGVLKGVADYHGLNLDAPMIYGLSGHAFLINIHTQLCPSSPYCWKRENATPLIANMGMRMTDLGFFSEDAKPETRAGVEWKLRAALDRQVPCSLINMENQIISGYDATGLLCTQPWGPKNRFTPGKLTFGSWAEFGKECHVNFYTIEKVRPAERRAAVLASLDYAVDMWRNPLAHSSRDYGAGPNAYDNWIAAIPPSGSSHGNWWNATVWSECRAMAAEYVLAIGKDNKDATELCAQISADYLRIAEALRKVGDKAVDAVQKVALLQEAKSMEAKTIGKVQKLAVALRAP